MWQRTGERIDDGTVSESVVRLFRSPTLDTVSMVEKTIEKYSGKFKKTELWEKLPRQVMWKTYLTILDYLQEINKIVISENGVITYIWKPKLAERYMKKRGLKYEKKKAKTEKRKKKKKH